MWQWGLWAVFCFDIYIIYLCIYFLFIAYELWGRVVCNGCPDPFCYHKHHRLWVHEILSSGAQSMSVSRIKLRKLITRSLHTGIYTQEYQWRIQGGGVQGVRTPPFGPRCRLFNIGPKVGPPLGPPPLFSCRPKMDPSGGSRVCVWQGWSPRPPWNVDDVTRAMSKGGVLVNVQEWGCFSIFLRADDVTRAMPKGGCLWKILYPRLDPPFQKSWIRPWIYTCI